MPAASERDGSVSSSVKAQQAADNRRRMPIMAAFVDRARKEFGGAKVIGGCEDGPEGYCEVGQVPVPVPLTSRPQKIKIPEPMAKAYRGKEKLPARKRK